MKISNLKKVVLENKQRGRVALLLCICLLWVAAASVAQETPGRVTGLQLGDTPEGSRVTVVSDSALGDYEAFRRGDRFYVKIPMANLATAAPTFRAAGFDDMQVQKQGSSIVVSFKLQPGASAHVDQHGNRLDVLFSSPNRTAAIGSNAASRNSQVNRDRGPDAAGPVPPDTVTSASRPRVYSEQSPSVSVDRLPQKGVAQKSQKGSGNANSTVAVTGSSAQSSASQSPAPTSSPSSLLTPGNGTKYSPVGTSTPTTAGSSTSPASSNGNFDWRRSFESAKQWISANRLASLLAALILLSLIAYLVLALRGRRQNGYKAKSAKTPKVQPKYSEGEELREVSNAQTVAKEDTPVARSAAAGSNAGTAKLLTRPTIVSKPVSQPEQSSEPEDREVFEL
ncbi:MAG TPA: hypothetical protein VLL54_15190 [Pyrinomonadaceae bacterium]|nr:hypothetical protein [Pyrinomonadaceae bacterium]